METLRIVDRALITAREALTAATQLADTLLRHTPTDWTAVRAARDRVDRLEWDITRLEARYDSALARAEISYGTVEKPTYRPADGCPLCGGVWDIGPLTMVCVECGATHRILSFGWDGMDPFADGCGVSYKRSIHFREWVANLQGKGVKLRPHHDAQVGALVAAHEGPVTRKEMTDMLRGLKLQEYYDGIPGLLLRHCGIEPIVIPPEVEQRMYTMFARLQAPFQRAVNKVQPGRVNMLGYEYLCRRLLQLCGHGDLSRGLKLLRSRSKLKQLDRIWRLICEDTGWEYMEHVR